VKITHHAGKGGQRIFPGRGALNDIVKKRPSINNYAKAAPNVVRNGPNVVGKKP
jgi:hypothetical protein